MQDVNPYAAPQHDLPPNAAAVESGFGIWRDGELLVMHTAAVLPDRCVQCNAPAAGRLKLRLSWMAPFRWFGLSIPIVERHVVIQVGVCAHHLRQRRRRVSIARLVFVLSFGAIVALVGRGMPAETWFQLMAYSACAILLVTSAAFESAFDSPPVKRQKARGEYVWLRKFNPEYLAQFPPFRERTREADAVGG